MAHSSALWTGETNCCYVVLEITKAKGEHILKAFYFIGQQTMTVVQMDICTFNQQFPRDSSLLSQSLFSSVMKCLFRTTLLNCTSLVGKLVLSSYDGKQLYIFNSGELLKVGWDEESLLLLNSWRAFYKYGTSASLTRIT